MDSDVLVAATVHWSAKVEVFDVKAKVSSASLGIGDNTIEVKFGSDEIYGW